VTRVGAPLGVIVAAKLVLSLTLVGSGFFAISDDDFSRLVIAQAFAVVPKLDPSGTSWLPLPFFAYGTVFTLFGKSLFVARVAGLVFGLLAALGIYLAARWLSLSRATALGAGLIGAAFPHAAYYGAATVPDYPTAVLVLLGAVSLSAKDPRIRLLGALAAAAATLCRYETWPVAAVVAIYAIFDWRSSPRQWPLTATALLAPLGAFAWLLHGLVHHHDAFFFIKRVTAYKRALGRSPTSWFEQLTAQPQSFIRGEPELVVLTLSLLVTVALVVGKQGLAGTAWRRPTLALFALVVFLVIGDLRDGAPTHHGERVLLSLWCGLALVSAELLTRLLAALPRLLAALPRPATQEPTRLLAALPRLLVALPRPATQGLTVFGLGLLVAVTAFYVRPKLTPVEPFVDRARELALGQHLATYLRPDESVAVYTEDYGYFAVDAALGRPGAVKPLLTRDPRHPEADPLSEPELLAARLTALGVRTFVVPATHQPPIDRAYQHLTNVAGFALYRRN
jgi:hypothetical protein